MHGFPHHSRGLTKARQLLARHLVHVGPGLTSTMIELTRVSRLWYSVGTRAPATEYLAEKAAKGGRHAPSGASDRCSVLTC
jgi:hypothetical protein